MSDHPKAGARLRAIGMVLVVLAVACQDAITDVGNLEDDALDNTQALEPLLNGMGRELSSALGLVAFTGAAVGREVVGSGSQFMGFGITLSQRNGILDPVEADEHWSHAQRARWVAEDGVRRMRAVLGDDFATSELAARALLHVGFANRLLGENMCLAVIDGGAPQPREKSFERAVEAFDEALEIADRIGNADLATAARAGRASTRVGLGDWTGARTDAEGVPIDFEYGARYSDHELEQYNRIYWATAGQPNRSLSVWNTFYEEYYRESGDPRTAWRIDPDHPEGEPGVPFYIQQKYTGRDSPIHLVSGREMRLIVAESRLVAGSFQSAVDAINEVRLLAGVEPRVVDSLEEAWSALKRERGIELWLEGRRLGDLSRWISQGVPGEAEDMSGRDTCFPIGTTEIDTNPNIP
jgi:hypothetical protein